MDLSTPDNESQRELGRGSVSRRDFPKLGGLGLGAVALSRLSPRRIEAGSLDLDPIIDITAPTF
jgi:hypothetical protein